MLNQCQNCGGALTYDIASGRLQCAFCKSDFDPDTYVSKTAAEEYTESQTAASASGSISSGKDKSADSISNKDNYELTLFSCPACGAQISSTEMAAVDYCMYCGSFVTLESQIKKVRKPDRILPFSKTVEECKDSYAKMIRRKLYAPKEFRDPSFLEGFKGIYIPYWSYDYSFGPNVEIRGETSTRHGNYLHRQQYSIHCDVDGKYDGVTYDASSTFDDEISSKIAPYDAAHVKPFNPSYMFGFFGDTADVPEEEYRNDADKTVRDYIWDAVSNDKEVKKGHPQKPSTDNNFDTKFKLKKQVSLTMMPVWFLTWRKNNKVAYSIVNGDSGEIYSEVPVDAFRYLLISLFTAIPIFILLNNNFTFNGPTMVTLALLLSVAMLMLYVRELERIVRRHFHADDRGYLYKHKEAKDALNNYKENLVLSAFYVLLGLLFEGGFLGLILFGCAVLYLWSYSVIILVLLIFFVPIYSIYRIFYCARIIHANSVILDFAGAMAALIISIVTLITDPAGDMFYYFAAIVCMIAIGLTAIRTMLRYNDLVTRPVPHFFEREKGGKV